jgi:predicted nuclease of predicted toxin-antitoxin system
LKFLADENISNKVVNALKSRGIDIISIKEVTSGIDDVTVLENAYQQNRVVITFDADFGELVFRRRLQTRGVILLKFIPKSHEQIIETILNILETGATLEGTFIIAQEEKMRVLRLR